MLIYRTGERALFQAVLRVGKGRGRSQGNREDKRVYIEVSPSLSLPPNPTISWLSSSLHATAAVPRYKAVTGRVNDPREASAENSEGVSINGLLNYFRCSSVRFRNKLCYLSGFERRKVRRGAQGHTERIMRVT